MTQRSVKQLLAATLASGLAACGEPAGSSAMRDRDGRSNQAAVSGPIDLGTLGGSSSFVSAVNARGQVIGNSATAGNSGSHAFLWQSDTGMIDLGTLGGPFSFASGINALGQIVGDSRTAGNQTHAFLWQSGTMIDLGTLGGTFSSAVAINALGQVVGVSTTATNFLGHAFLWQRETGMIDLGTLGGSPFSSAITINALGQVLGSSTRAFLWQNATGMIDLGTLGGFVSSPFAMNDLGQVVGTSDTPFFGPRHAFLWQSGTMIDLGVLGVGKQSSTARAINASGQVVGVSDAASADQSQHPIPRRGFLWESGTGMVDLGTLGGNFSQALAINTRGQVVGSSNTGDDENHAFLWQSGTGMTDLGTLGGNFSNAFAINDHGQIVGISSTAGGQIHAALWNTIQTPAEQLADLSDAVASLGAAGKLNQGQMQALQAKLDAAGRQLDSAKKTAANVLRAFTNQVQAFVSATILSASEGQTLIDAAQALINELRT